MSVNAVNENVGKFIDLVGLKVNFVSCLLPVSRFLKL